MKPRLKHRRAWSGVNVIESLESRTLFSVDLSATIAISSPKTLRAKPGQSATVAIVLTNIGTTKAAGPLSTVVTASANADGSSPFASAVVKDTLHLAPGAHTTIHASVKLPSTLDPGTYFAAADVDPSNTFSETSLTNNTAITANPLTVFATLPDLLGTWSGSGTTVRSGVSGTFTETDTYVTENFVTGAFTGTGMYDLGNGIAGPLQFTGKVTAKSTFAQSGADVPIDVAGTFHSKGKVTGDTIQLAFTDALGTGTLTLTKVS